MKKLIVALGIVVASLIALVPGAANAGLTFQFGGGWPWGGGYYDSYRRGGWNRGRGNLNRGGRSRGGGNRQRGKSRK